MMKRKIYSANSKRYKPILNLPKPATKDIYVENTTASTNKRAQKLFFEMEYLFSDPVCFKKQAKRKQVPSQIKRATIGTSQLSCNLTKSELVHPNQKQKQPINNSFFNLSSIAPSEDRKCRQVELVFDERRPGEMIHHRRMASLDHPFSHKNHSKEHYKLAQCESQTIEECLTTRSFVKEFEKDEINKKIDVRKSHKFKKNEAKIKILAGVGEIMLARKKNWFQSQQFRQYYNKEVQFAKRAFIDKNKQTIKIYRPWTPTQFQLEESENVHF